jgi:hypothetical protein
MIEQCDIDAANATRYWSAIAQYDDLDPFYFGSVMLPLDARIDEVETALTISWATVFPFAPPPRFSPIAGTVWFRHEE